jgi:hypothetical protein
VGVRRGGAALLLFASLAAPGTAEDVLRLPIGDPARRDREAPVVLDAITDTASGALLTPAELPKRLEGVLAAKPLVVCGLRPAFLFRQWAVARVLGRMLLRALPGEGFR